MDTYKKILYRLPKLEVGDLIYSIDTDTGQINAHQITKFEFNYNSKDGLDGFIYTINPYNKRSPDVWSVRSYGKKWVFTYEEVMGLLG